MTTLASNDILITFHSNCLPDIQIALTIKAVKKYVASKLKTATEINLNFILIRK